MSYQEATFSSSIAAYSSNLGGAGTHLKSIHILTLMAFPPLSSYYYSNCIAGIAKGFYQFTGQIEEMDRVIWTGKCINEKVRTAYRRRREREWNKERREGGAKVCCYPSHPALPPSLPRCLFSPVPRHPRSDLEAAAGAT